jgi:hypothetical protein
MNTNSSKASILNQQTRQDFLKTGAIASFSFLLGSQGLFGQKASAQTSSTDHPNVAIIKRYYDAYGKGDIATVREYYNPIVLSQTYGDPSELARGFSITNT